MAGRELALFDHALVNDEVAELLDCVSSTRKRTPRARISADVADLSARLAVEGRLIEDQRAARAFLQRKVLAAVDE